MNPNERFYIKREDCVEGPYDLMEMGQFLLEKKIAAETPVRVEGSSDWQPFDQYPQYEIIREASVDSVARVEQMEAEGEATAPIIPVPSKQTVVSFLLKILVLLLFGVIAYVAGWCDHTVGIIIVVLGMAVSAIAQCLIFGRVWGEDFSTIGKVSLIPFYDAYYFGSNLDSYLASFLLKYGGLTVTIAAAAGMGELHVRFH